MRLCSLLAVCILALTPLGVEAAVNINADPHALPPANYGVTVHRIQAFNAAGLSVGACIRDAVKADPRFADALRKRDIRDLIVDATPTCRTKVNEYIAAHDRLFGTGGVDHFVDKFLYPLPGALLKYFTDTARQ